MKWRQNIPLLLLIMCVAMLGVWWLVFADDPPNYNKADVDYPRGTYEAVFAKTIIVPGVPLKYRDFEWRVIHGNDQDIIGSGYGLKNRTCKSLKMPGDRIVFDDLVPVMGKAVLIAKNLKGGEPITADSLKIVDTDILFCSRSDKPVSIEPFIGKTVKWDKEAEQGINEFELAEFIESSELGKYTRFKVRSQTSAPIAGELKTYTDKLLASVIKNWHWKRPFDGYTAIVTIETPSPYPKSPNSHSDKYYLYCPDNTRSGDKELKEALVTALNECGLPPIPAGAKSVMLGYDIEVNRSFPN